MIYPRRWIVAPRTEIDGNGGRCVVQEVPRVGTLVQGA